MKHVGRWVAGSAFAALVLFNLISGLTSGGPAPITHKATNPHDVRLHAATAYSGGMVALFAEVREGPDVGFTELPGGTRCTRIDGPYRLADMTFYRLNCGGTIGYVNEKLIK